MYAHTCRGYYLTHIFCRYPRPHRKRGRSFGKRLPRRVVGRRGRSQSPCPFVPCPFVPIERNASPSRAPGHPRTHVDRFTSVSLRDHLRQRERARALRCSLSIGARRRAPRLTNRSRTEMARRIVPQIVNPNDASARLFNKLQQNPNGRTGMYQKTSAVPFDQHPLTHEQQDDVAHHGEHGCEQAQKNADARADLADRRG